MRKISGTGYFLLGMGVESILLGISLLVFGSPFSLNDLLYSGFAMAVIALVLMFVEFKVKED